MKSLNPTIPVLPIGIFRYFRAVAYVCIGASPNEDIFIHPCDSNAEKYVCQSFFSKHLQCMNILKNFVKGRALLNFADDLRYNKAEI